ncbi:hypothetical protein D3C74_395070 [compost metagenome]
MLYILAINLVQHDIVVHQVTFLMLIPRQPVVSADMTLRRDEHNLHAQLQADLLQSIRKYTRPLCFCELNFTHNKSDFTQASHPSFLFLTHLLHALFQRRCRLKPLVIQLFLRPYTFFTSQVTINQTQHPK